MLKLLLILALAGTVPLSVLAKRGYLFLCPNTLGKKTTEPMSLTLYDVKVGGSVTVALLDSALNKTFKEVTVDIPNPSDDEGHSVAIQFPVPDVEDGSAMIRVTGNFSEDNYTFSDTSRVGLESHSNHVFIQTDQPIYKPDQTVRFRVIYLDYSLKFLEENQDMDIYIENSAGIRIFQSLKQSVGNNILQLEMKLSDQPALGTYNIYANDTKTGALTTQSFGVDEFVLPKFEVKITPPPFALFSDDKITFKICGRYTYGQLVNGNLTVSASYESYSWDRQLDLMPKIRHNGPVEGCYNFTVNQKELNWLNNTYRYRDIKLNAKITEAGTDIEQNATTTFKLSTDPVKISFPNDGSYNQYFKPGLPIFGTCTISNPDGTPKANEQVQLCLVATAEAQPSTSLYRLEKKLACKNYTSDEQGNVRYSLPAAPSKVTQLKIQADAINFPQYNNPTEPQSILYYRPTNSKQYNQWYSPSDHYIQVVPIEREAPCGEQLNLKVLLTGKDADVFKVYVHVMSRGQIVMQTSVTQEFKAIQNPAEVNETYIVYEDETSQYFKNDIQSGSFVIPLTIKPEMAPKAHVLVSYVLKESGEIVADALDISIAKCLKNNVSMSFTNAKQQPGTKVGLKINASPNSICGISVVDKSIRLLSSNGQITQDSVLKVIEQYESNSYYWYNNNGRCNFRPSVRQYDISVNRRKRSVNWRPDSGYSNKADSTTAIQKSKLVALTDLTLETKPCEQSGYGYNRPPIANYYHSTPMRTTALVRTKAKPGLAMRPQAANDMLEISKVGIVQEDAVRGSAPDGNSLKPVKEVRVDFPDTWLWELQQLDENGEAVIKPTLPDTITEWQGNAICISSKDGMGVSPTASVIGFQPFFVSHTLPYSIIRGEKSPVIVSVFNYLDKCLPVTLTIDLTEDFILESGSQNVTLCVCGGMSSTVTYLVKPKVLGKLNFTVRAYTISDAAVCAGKEFDTVSARDAATNGLIVEPEGFKRDVTISSFFCPEKDGGDLKTHMDLETPANLVEGSLKATFLVCGDLMGPTLKNIDKLIQMPTGCGEQNMINFVPDIYVLEYLEQTGRLTPEVKSKLEQYIRSGYQRELTYRHTDGSYSAFGTSDKTGSNWLTAFVVASFKGASKHIAVDNSDIVRSAAYLLSQQEKNGCFPELGEVHHRAMKGGVDAAKGSKALSAYILASLLESNTIGNESLAKGLACLATESDPPTYTRALATYASCLANSSDAKERLEALIAKATRKDGLMFWEDELTHSRSIQIEIGSYAILSILLPCGGENVTQALEIVKWISTKRNANGGFDSTQDTVLALKALSKYGTYISKEPVNLKITAESNGLKESFTVDETNKLLVQSAKVPDVPSPLDIEGSGTGCGLVQTNLRYNVQKPENDAGFTLDITTARGAGNSCKKATFTACIGYKVEDQDSVSSNMAILDIRLVSGYTLDVDSIPPLMDDPELYYKRNDVKGDSVALYFGKVGAKKCFTIGLIQEFEVQDIKPGTAKLFDYYQTEKQVSKEYSIDSVCP